MDYTTTSLFEKMNPLRVALLDGNLRTRRSIVLCSVLLLISAFYVRQTSSSASHLSEICQDADHPPSSASESWIGSFFPTAQASNISDQCVQDTRNYIAALCNRTMWAIKMYESSGKMIDGLIHTGSGNPHHETGLFDECLAIQPSGVPFQGKYCTVFFDLKSANVSNKLLDSKNNIGANQEEPEETVTYFQMPSVAFCLPSTCGAVDLRSAVAQRLGHREINKETFSLVAISNENFCFSQQKLDTDSKFDAAALTVMSIFCLIVATVATATLHQMWKEKANYDGKVGFKKEHLAVRALYCFSLIENGRSLLSTKDNVKGSISCLHGIRVLSMFWIVLLHISEESFSRYTHNRVRTQEIALQWAKQGVVNGLIAVDTFFLIGGLIVSHSQLNQLDRNGGHFNFKRFYFHRYIRITPLYAAVVAFMATLYRYTGNGPDWYRMQQMSQVIRDNWWAHMLYITNYIPKVEKFMGNPLTAMSETWYLSCDMQMFLISPLFIYPLWRWKKAGLVWAFTGLLGFLVAALMLYTMNENLIPTFLFSRTKDMNNIDTYCAVYYNQVYARIPPYLVGIILGSFLHWTKDRKLNWSPQLVATGWTVASLVALTVPHGLIPYLDETKVPTIPSFIRISYGALHRTAWAMAVAWIIFACTHGYGGWVHRLLSWKLFVPLARLCYAVYLIHYSFIKAYSSHMRKPLYYTDISIFVMYLGVLVLCIVIASVASLLIEIPFLNLDKLLWPNKCKSPKALGRLETGKPNVNGAEELNSLQKPDESYL